MHQLAALFLSLAIGAGSFFVFSSSAIAKERPFHYRLLFVKGSAKGIWRGKHVASNNVVLGRITKILRHWPKRSGMRFVLVAKRWSSCQPDRDCNRLFWTRQTATVSKIKQQLRGDGKKLGFSQFAISFVDELEQAVHLPPPPRGAEAVDIFIQQDRQPTGKDCPWRLLISDPSLPPLLPGATPSVNMALPPGQSLPVGSRATYTINAKGGLAPIGVWENKKGQYLQAEAGGTIPPSAIKLHLVSFANGRPPQGLKTFLTAISKGFVYPRQAPRFLRAGSPRKGIEDHGQFLPPGVRILLPQKTVCHFGLHRF